MLQKRIIITLFIAISGILVVYFLYKTTIGKEPPKSGFVRKFASVTPKVVSILNTEDENYYYPGNINGKLVFANTKIINQILLSDTALKDTLTILTPLADSMNPSTVEITTSNGYAFISDRSSNRIARVDLMNLQDFKIIKPYRKFFTAWPFKKNNFFLNVSDRLLRQSIIVKFPDNITHPQNYIPTRQGDGYFSVDGFLLYSENLEYLFFIYYYTNKIARLDSNLKVLANYATIDTIRIPSNKIVEYNDGKTKTMGGVPVYINKKACLYNSYILIHSTRIADNEKYSLFKQNFVFDVYFAENGVYKFSFYLPNLSHKEISSVGVMGNLLIVTYREQGIAIFSLDFN